MKRSELIRRVQEMEKDSAVVTAWGILFIVIFLAAFLGYVWIGGRFVVKIRSLVLLCVFLASLVALIIGYICFFVWLGNNSCRKYGLCCPSCNQVFEVQGLEDALSNKCSECGGLMYELDGESGEEQSKEYLAAQTARREHLIKQIRSFEKEYKPRALGIAVVFSGASFMYAALVFVRYGKLWSDAARWMLLIPMIGFIVSCLTLIARERIRLIRKYHLHCVHCGRQYDL